MYLILHLKPETREATVQEPDGQDSEDHVGEIVSAHACRFIYQLAEEEVHDHGHEQRELPCEHRHGVTDETEPADSEERALHLQPTSNPAPEGVALDRS